jgi:hypothetical protein
MDLHERHYDIFRGEEGRESLFSRVCKQFSKRYSQFSKRVSQKICLQTIFFTNEKYLFQLVTILKQKEN